MRELPWQIDQSQAVEPSHNRSVLARHPVPSYIAAVPRLPLAWSVSSSAYSLTTRVTACTSAGHEAAMAGKLAPVA
jgi:hypothetical protein